MEVVLASKHFVDESRRPRSQKRYVVAPGSTSTDVDGGATGLPFPQL